ncbi:hypothetical protein X551_03928 [Methylibium sp. T29]|nr:hypothetical protein X551_03928 [Methylibium sp. T29]EWS57785.1 hypothetical protein Y694_04272 [Methylibium sp. T29-B]
MIQRGLSALKGSWHQDLHDLAIDVGYVRPVVLPCPNLGRKDVTPADLDAIRSRIGRAFAAAQDPFGAGYQTFYQASGTDFTTSFRALGVKDPKQLEDDFLNLFIWTWSLKDYLKSVFDAKGLSGKAVEEEVNRCPALTYVADIANRAKHGSLRESRSGQFAELVDVGFDAPQDSIDRITVAGRDVTLDIKNIQLIQIHATVATNTGARLDALAVLSDAMHCLETRIRPSIAA